MVNISVIVMVVGLLLVGSASAYYCIEEEDNLEVKQFKSNVNLLAFKQDIQKNSLTREQFETKLKYFSGCN